MIPNVVVDEHIFIILIYLIFNTIEHGQSQIEIRYSYTATRL